MTRSLDSVDHIVSQWARVRPDVDVSAVEIVGRVSRLSRIIDQRLGENFARHGIEDWMYDVMATLRRQGEPYELTAGQLVRATMVTTGAMTNRIDRLVERGFVERAAGSDRRTVIVRLTPDGLALVDRVVHSHLASEEAMLEPLSEANRAQLVRLLRAVLVGVGDVPST